jgi:hypothetical protein
VGENFGKYFCFVTILDMSLISRSCKNDHIIFNVGTTSLEARNIRLVNIITYIIEESKLISENMSPNVIQFKYDEYLWGKYPQFLDMR